MAQRLGNDRERHPVFQHGGRQAVPETMHPNPFVGWRLYPGFTHLLNKHIPQISVLPIRRYMLDKNIFTVRDRAAVFKIVYNRPAHIISKRQSQVFLVFFCVKEMVFSVQLIKLNSRAFISQERSPILAASRKMA